LEDLYIYEAQYSQPDRQGNTENVQNNIESTQDNIKSTLWLTALQGLV
jgi:hypothetical protein